MGKNGLAEVQGGAERRGRRGEAEREREGAGRWMVGFQACLE